jgi:N-methylhydantoinase A/oxoprolinase/acetone carboxylase beta subunit
VNAYVGPKIERYLSRLDARLREAGFTGELSSCSRTAA